ncbi:hypothetical protein BV898_12549 [Hypsibius exemplaris]|uniref:Ribosomal RNA-processing protein 14/surfeit locus protein 6 C-terminal domain-containing protein n=1 Tax=Hypsibius exemplaris TaxID=2072580 RepID=A0A1W0WDD1_HYPEX|nr:hypothetical protein BV898_12549 [Hypsibius exemplaris]
MKVDINSSRIKSKKKLSLIKEQEVPLSNGSLDDSSSSMPSSPSTSSSAMEDVIRPPSVELFPPAADRRKLASASKKSAVHINGTSPHNFHHASLLEKARNALAGLVPLFDKMPQEVVFGEDVLESIKAPSFASFCETVRHTAPVFMQPSAVLRQLEDFARKGSPSSSQSAFKRPHSPHATNGTVNSTGPQEKKRAKLVAAAAKLVESAPSSDELKSRLQDKLHAFKVKRKAFFNPAEAATFNEVRRKLRKLKKKEKTRDKKKADKAADKSALKANCDGDGNSTPSSARSSSVVSEEGKMIFSRFDFFETDGEKKLHPQQQIGKNLTHLINKAEAEKRRLDHLEEHDEKKANDVRTKKAWSEAMLKAQGVKLKNDPVKLKHALKEQAKRKDKSAKKWQERAQNIQQEQKQRQDKRQTNIKARQSTKKDKKRKRSIKRGHIIPGFN